MVCQNPFFSDFSPILSLTAGSFSCALQGIFVFVFCFALYFLYVALSFGCFKTCLGLDVKLL